MPRKDLRYYARTIALKTNAEIYFHLQQMGLLNAYQTKQKKKFEQLYNAHLANKKISINTSFSSIYTAYSFFEKKEEIQDHLLFDSRNVVMCRSDVKPYYNPLLAAHYALVCYNDYVKNGSEKALSDFYIQLDYLGNQAVANAYRFYYDWEGQHFYSGITQSVVASVFMRAYHLEKTEQYTQKDIWKGMAYQTLSQMFIPLEEGGTLIYDTEGDIWIEEYPRLGRLSMVLNGFIYSLIGVYEYLALCGNDETLDNYAQQMTKSLFKSLHFYKFDRFTRYSRFEKTFENIDYEGRNYYLFQHLYDITHNAAFEKLMLDTEKCVNWQAFYRFYDKSY
jgi:D-glucuronyl C5-epimerase C-terminus